MPTDAISAGGRFTRRWAPKGLSLYPVLLVLCLAPLTAAATSCVVKAGTMVHVRQSFEAADHVFSAYVEGIESGVGFGREMSIAHLRVLQVWKGAFRPGDSVVSTAEESVRFEGDGFVPEINSGLLVYAVGTEPLLLHVCSRTARLEPATAEIPLLNRLSKKPAYRFGR